MFGLKEIPDRGMVNVGGVYESREEAETAANAYSAQYHPTGYGTIFQIRQSAMNRKMWFAEGFRYASCD